MARQIANLNEIIIHVLDTPVSGDFGLDDVNQWHRERGFTDQNGDGIYCGYHFIIKLDGTLQVGRPLDRRGAHCKGRNRFSIGIALEGGANGEDTRTKAQNEMLHDLVVWLCRILPSIHSISGHNDYSAKSCPNFNVREEFWYIGGEKC